MGKEDRRKDIIMQHFCFNLLTHKGPRGEVEGDLQSCFTSTAQVEGCLDQGFVHGPIVQLLTLHQHRANNQHRTANEI